MDEPQFFLLLKNLYSSSLSFLAKVLTTSSVSAAARWLHAAAGPVAGGLEGVELACRSQMAIEIVILFGLGATVDEQVRGVRLGLHIGQLKLGVLKLTDVPAGPNTLLSVGFDICSRAIAQVGGTVIREEVYCKEPSGAMTAI